MTSWLHEQRLRAVQSAVEASGAARLLDLGCGDGDLLVRLAATPAISEIVGIDLSEAALGHLRTRLDALGQDIGAPGSAESPPGRTIGPTIRLIHGSFTDSAEELVGFDCATLVETIEHINPKSLSIVERSVFATMRPATVIITTPNADFNPMLGVPAHRFRHPDHRFEWGRARFRRWAEGIARRHGYRAACSDIAGCHPVFGGASQMAIFT